MCYLWDGVCAGAWKSARDLLGQMSQEKISPQQQPQNSTREMTAGD
jgi:hypothetical protein